MSGHSSSSLILEVPADWVDRSVIAFSAPRHPAREISPNIVVTRDVADEDGHASSYADRQLVELAKRLSEFCLLARRESVLGGMPGVEIEFTWTGAAGLIHQRQIFNVRGTVVFSTVITASGDDYSAWRPTFDSILATMWFP